VLSLIHPGHGREPQELQKIRNTKKRHPLAVEQDVANQLEITNCKQKSAYISYSEDIDLEMDFLSRNYFAKKFYTGEEKILQEMEGWMMHNVRNTKIQSYYRWMILILGFMIHWRLIRLQGKINYGFL
jgi:hypothetical protein